MSTKHVLHFSKFKYEGSVRRKECSFFGLRSYLIVHPQYKELISCGIEKLITRGIDIRFKISFGRTRNGAKRTPNSSQHP